MNSLLIIGAGGHGCVVKEIAYDLGYRRVDFLDDNNPIDAIGKISEMSKFLDYGSAICSIGNNELRQKITLELLDAGFIVPVLVHPSAYVSSSARIAQGVVIEAHATVNAGCEISEGVIVGIGALVDHNAKVGSYAHVNSGAIVKAGGFVPSCVKIDSGRVVDGYI